MNRSSDVRRHAEKMLSFFYPYFVFLLTLVREESIHSSTAITIAALMQTIERENRQMATKKAPAKKAVKKADKKAAKKK